MTVEKINHLLRYALRELKPGWVPDNLQITYFDAAHKLDPLNEKVLLVVESNIGGAKCAWIVEARNAGDKDALLIRVTQAMAEEMASKPDQLREQANLSRRDIG